MRLARLVLCLGLLGSGPAAADHMLVLVTGVSSPLDSVSVLELRKIYLGVTVRRNGIPLKPLRNLSDRRVNQIFLQTVMAMSEQAYERRLLSATLRYGRARPAEYHDLQKLIDELLHTPGSVTYMWREDAEKRTDLKVIRLLWHGD